MSALRILLVDDHSLFRESLGRLVEGEHEIRVVGQCATVADALEVLSRAETDVVLLDYDLGEESGFRLLTELRRRGISAKTLMVTAGLSDEATSLVMEAGASGIFLKHSSPDQLLAAIRQVALGEIWLDNAALRGLLAARHDRNEVAERTQPLTIRQAEVLRGILNGLANKEIAWKLKVSETSVKAAVQELFQKAGVRTRSQLVRIAIEQHSTDWLRSAETR